MPSLSRMQLLLATVASLAFATSPSMAQDPPGGDPKKIMENLLKGYERVISTSDGRPSMFTLHVNRKEGQAIVELPKDFDRKKYFIALTVASGELYAGLQAGDLYVQWKTYGNRLALIEPDLETRSTGDLESKSSVQRLFTGKVLADVQILTTPPNSGPVINLNDLLLSQAPKFFGLKAGAISPRLKEIKTAKAFPQNIEIAYEVPFGDGKLKTLHYSISEIQESTGYTPRVADDRVGYFTTAYNDLGKYKRGETRTRYINRWHLEKADPSLKMSPPKNPIVFYVEHTTPIRYRRFVRDGVLYWNQAFEKVGLNNAIEVHFQDARTGAHMDKDPEDVRYNFIRWLNNNVGTAIGPSRVHPLTGQILDADIILTDGWIRHFDQQFHEMLPQLAMEGFAPETLAWLEQNPQWDPRYLLGQGHERNRFLAEQAKLGPQALGGHPFAQPINKLLGTNEFDGLTGRVSQVNGMCLAARGKAFDLALLSLSMELLEQEQAKLQKPENKEEPKKTDEDELDGIPARFIGPMLADLVAHEVGHTLGLRHNFKASSLYSMAEVNSNKVKGKKPFAGSVMDYLPININMKDGEVQGDYTMISVGPYDMWAIEYGYTFDKELKPILARGVEPENQYGTDQDTIGPDPLIRRYDFSSNPLDYAKNQGNLAKYHRERILDKFVKDGDSWSKARRGYEQTLTLQVRALNMMAAWIGGTHVRRDHKGDKGNRVPLEAVQAKVQRDALRWVVDSAFQDSSFGLTPELLQRMKNDALASDESMSKIEEASFPLHDKVMGVQSSVLTMLLNPSTLRRVYDNEFLVDREKEALTLPDLLDTVAGSVFTELDRTPNGPFTTRKPMVSSLRRNLQRELVDRMIDLSIPSAGSTPAGKTITTLASMHLRQLMGKIQNVLKVDGMDAYTKAHLLDAQTRISKALDAQYMINPRENSRQPFQVFLHPRPTNARCEETNCRHCNRPE